MINLTIEDPYKELVEPDIIERASSVAFSKLEISFETSVSIVVTDDNQLHQLNLQFAGIDEPTDVLSFPAGYTDPDTETLYLGDILLSYPRALEQAKKAGHAVEDELQLLVVHGILHLTGYDHSRIEDKALMWAAQKEILSILGVDIKKTLE